MPLIDHVNRLRFEAGEGNLTVEDASLQLADIYGQQGQAITLAGAESLIRNGMADRHEGAPVSTALPALPAGLLDVPEGHTMTVEEMVDALREMGPELAYLQLPRLYRDTMELIRDGHPDPVGLAVGVLAVDEALRREP